MSERADTAYSPRFREEGLVGCCGNELAAQPANFFTLQLEGFSIMRDATFFPTEEQCRRMAKGYVLTDDKPAKEVTVNQFQYPYSLHSRYPEAGGGLFGSPMDMIKFFAMQRRAIPPRRRDSGRQVRGIR